VIKEDESLQMLKQTIIWCASQSTFHR
jgi:hypothetical protein